MAGEIIILSAEGGGSLNYEVVNGTSTPSSPSENTIWVNTSTAITSHVFSSTKPSSPSAGMVWFNIGTSSPAAMNVLDDDDKLYVYPIGCMQYVSGAWVSKTAKTYIGGAWVDWIAYLYNSGSTYDTLTGGWESFAPLQYGLGTATKNTSNLSVSVTSGAEEWKSAAFGTTKSINLSSYTKLHITASSASGGSGDSCTKFGVTDTKDTSSWNDTPQAVLKSGENTLDISSVNSGYIWFGCAQRTTGTKSAVVTKIWLS